MSEVSISLGSGSTGPLTEIEGQQVREAFDYFSDLQPELAADVTDYQGTSNTPAILQEDREKLLGLIGLIEENETEVG